jgi:hypothetical protein
MRGADVVRIRLAHATSRAPVARPQGRHRGAEASGWISSRASASRMRRLCPAPPAGATEIPRAASPGFAPTSRRARASPAAAEIDLSTRPSDSDRARRRRRSPRRTRPAATARPAVPGRSISEGAPTASSAGPGRRRRRRIPQRAQLRAETLRIEDAVRPEEDSSESGGGSSGTGFDRPRKAVATPPACTSGRARRETGS